MNIYKEIINEIKKNDKIIITTHVRADGDCVGSAIGLREMIKHTFKGKDVKASYEYVDYLKFLGRCDEIEDSEFENALVISVDNAELSRANDKRIEKASKIIKIDHHPNVNPFGYINFVEDEKSSCAEIIFDLFLKLPRRKISIKGLEAIYTGMMTDTGFLKYKSVTGDTFKKIGLLYDFGVDGTKIRNILDEISMEELRLKGYVFEHMESTPNGVLYAIITPEIREKYNVEYDEASNMVGALANVEGHPIWVLVNEYKPDEIRCRVRSLEIPINEVARNFGGGGHKNASGIVVKDYETVNKILNALDELLKN